MPLDSRQFGRAVQVEIVPPSGPGVLINPNTSPGAPQLRVSAVVKKGIGQPASATVDAWNLAESTRRRAAGVTRRVIDFSSEFDFLDGRLVTGADFGDGKAEQISRANGFGYLRISGFYQGAGTTVALFEGTSTSVVPIVRKPNTITRITGGDGVIQAGTAIADRQWRDTTSAAVVLEYVIREVMGTTLSGAVAGNFGAGLPAALQGLTLQGGYDATWRFATDVLDSFAELTRTEWWWDDGVIYWLAEGEALAGAAIPLDTKPRTDAYQILQAPAQAEDNLIRVPLLLLPELRPGRLASIGSGEFRGDYITRTVTHSIDNRGSRAAQTTAILARVGVLPFE